MAEDENRFFGFGWIWIIIIIVIIIFICPIFFRDSET